MAGLSRRISYGLYIFHSLVFFLIFKNLGPYLGQQFPALRFGDHPDLRNAAGAALVLAISIGVAHLSYRYFEKPFLRLNWCGCWLQRPRRRWLDQDD